MASIRNSISLQDRMTPVFRSIIKSMDSTLRVMSNLDKQANKGTQSKAYRRAEKDIKRANNELIKMQNHLSLADRGAGKLATSSGKIASNMSRISGSGFNLRNLASGLYLLKNIGDALSSIMETPDTMNAIQYRLDTYDTSKATGNQLFDAAYMAAMRSRSDVGSTSSLASRILVSGATDGSGADAIGLAEILNKASFIGGSSAQESQRALLQLSQGLASGLLQGDELRAIREQAPGLTDVLARGLSSLGEKGLLPDKFIGTTMGDLKALGAEGELTSDRIIAAFQEMEDYVNETFENSPKQFGQAMSGIGNVWKRWLKLMSQGDNAFARINDAAWDLLDWFESDSGMQFMTNLANGVNSVVDAMFKLIEGVGNAINWFNNLDNSTEILSSALISLAAVAVGAGVAMFIAWIQATWPILLAIAAIGLLVYAFQMMGFTAGEIIGAVCGAVMFLAYVIWDAVLVIILAIAAVLAIVLTVAIGAVAIVIWAILAVVQLFLWLVQLIVAILATIYSVFATVWHSMVIIAEGAVIGILEGFNWLGQGVLGVLYDIASAIDWVFGSNLASTVSGWMSGLDGLVGDVVTELSADVEARGGRVDDLWANAGDLWTSWGDRDNDFNIFDAFDSVGSGAGTLIEGAWNGVGDIDNSLYSVWANPMEGWNSGFDFGDGLGTSIGDFSMELSDIGSLMGGIDKNGLSINGGNLDSVGSIKSDVDISDEDLKLLRDIAAREFLLNLKTVTPSVNVKFGDVHETADVDRIMEVIQDMVDEELATSMVVD